MNIAHIIPSSIGYPLGSHNGRYDWVYELAKLQAANGHNVTVYGNKNSHIDGVRTVGLPHPSGDKIRDNRDIFLLAFSHNNDIYHSHFDNLHYQMAHETKRPIIFTQHWWPTDETIHAAQSVQAINVWAVPLTKFMYEHDQSVGIQTRGYIYHGIDLTLFQPSTITQSDRLLFVGRISPEKNLDLAISVAKKAKAKLDIIGKIAPKNQHYWQSIESSIDGDTIRYIGTKNHRELINYYSSARGVLFPSDINEPFGLVAIEAQACGTPVIMQNGGSRGELIQDGRTGFLCTDESDYIAAIASLDTIDPADCTAFAQHFDIHSMVKHYNDLYAILTNG